MRVPELAIDLAKRFEGFHRVPKFELSKRAYPYVCPAGYWTIGYGHLCDKDHHPISEREGAEYLRNPAHPDRCFWSHRDR